MTFERSKSLKAPYPLSHHPNITRVQLRTFNSTFHQTKGRNKWMDESDRNNIIESTLDNGSVVKFEISGCKMSKSRKSSMCNSKTCCSKVFLKNEKVRNIKMKKKWQNDSTVLFDEKNAQMQFLKYIFCRA